MEHNQTGIECPLCGCAESVVARTLQQVDATKRYRRCMKCGQNFTTTELVDVKERRVAQQTPTSNELEAYKKTIKKKLAAQSKDGSDLL